MTLDGEVYEAGDAGRGWGAPSSPVGRCRASPAVLGAVLAAVLAVAGVLVVREPPAGTASAAPPTAVPERDLGFVLDETGLGKVRLGMTGAEYRALHRDASGWDRALHVVATDEADGCVQFEGSTVAGPVDPRVWVWVRDGVVVAVGASRAPFYSAGRVTLPTSFGVDLGEAFDLGVSRGLGLRWRHGSPVPTARRDTAAGEVVLADVDRDGLLDYARVETPDAHPCDVDGAAGPPGLGSSTPGGAVPAPGGRVPAGTGTGRALADALAALAAEQTWWTPRGPLAGGETVARLADGTCVALASDPRPVLVDDLDRWYGLGEEVVRAATAGVPCPGSGGTGPTPVLDEGGLGPIRLGMTGTEVRALYGADLGEGRTLRLLGIDPDRECFEYDAGDRVVDAGGAAVRIRMHADAVVAVGLSLTAPQPPPGATGGVVAFGRALGEPLDSAVARDLGWRWSHDGLMPAAWTTTGPGRALLLDTDGDGLLDAARAESAAAAMCDLDEATSRAPAA